MKKLIKSIIPKTILQVYRNNKRRKKIKFYRGDDVLCPICKSQFRIFEPFGLIKRENARCHTCGSLERHRLLFKFLHDRTDFFKEKSTPFEILHFAPEKFFYDILLNISDINYVPCDLYPELFDYKGSEKVRKVDITNIPFESNSFDFILCNHVLEHIPDDNKAMSELYRVMKKSGIGIFQVPIDYGIKNTYEDFSITTPEGREKAFGQNDHVRWYGQDYKDKLESAGFEVTEDDYVRHFSEKEVLMYGVNASELIYYCHK